MESFSGHFKASEKVGLVKLWGGARGVYVAHGLNLVKDDIQSILIALNESSCKLRITQMDILSSPAKIWPHESQPFIHTWGGEKAKDTCPRSILRFLWPSGMSSGVAQVYETMSLIRTTKQNPKHNRAELDATRKWIISHSIPSLGKAAKPIGGVVNDCRTLTSMKALIVPHFRHYQIIEAKRQ